MKSSSNAVSCRWDLIHSDAERLAYALFVFSAIFAFKCLLHDLGLAVLVLIRPDEASERSG